MERIGEKIYNLRKEKGVSQEGLALELGVARQTVSKWEMDATQPTLENVECMCKFFGVSVSYFFENSEEGAGANEEGQFSAAAPEREEKYKTLKTVLMVAGAVALAFCIIFGIMAFYEAVASVEKGFSFIATTCLFIGIILASVIVTLLVLLIKKHRKK